MSHRFELAFVTRSSVPQYIHCTSLNDRIRLATTNAQLVS